MIPNISLTMSEFSRPRSGGIGKRVAQLYRDCPYTPCNQGFEARALFSQVVLVLVVFS